jgi:hypothetical protein
MVLDNSRNTIDTGSGFGSVDWMATRWPVDMRASLRLVRNSTSLYDYEPLRWCSTMLDSKIETLAKCV